jgi:hypothetical protein
MPLYSFGFGQRIIGWMITTADGRELATVRTRREARAVVRWVQECARRREA